MKRSSARDGGFERGISEFCAEGVSTRKGWTRWSMSTEREDGGKGTGRSTLWKVRESVDRGNCSDDWIDPPSISEFEPLLRDVGGSILRMSPDVLLC